MRKFVLMFVAALCAHACYNEKPVAVTVDFTVSVEDGDYSVPVLVSIENKSAGADGYLWTMEGGEPSVSHSRQPGTVRYGKAGTYVVRLEAWNIDERKSREFVLSLDSAVFIDFDFEVPVNSIMPARAIVSNLSTGGTSYRWTFENADPASSELYDPPPVNFIRAGEHAIRLTVANGRETFTRSKTVSVLPAMSLDFAIVPSFDDEDMEAPFTATLVNRSVSGLRYRWSCENAAIADRSASDSTVLTCAASGTYTVVLEADNDKEVKSASGAVVVKPNSNLYVMNGVKLGIRSAHSVVGCFYSCVLRRVISGNDVDSRNGPLTDFVFFGSDETFGRCRILSPDSAAVNSFYEIPGAAHTAVVNLVENSTISFTADDFERMTDDSSLKNLPVAENDSGEAWFNAGAVPRIVLFQTADGRRGAIRIREFAANGRDSYVVADIKVQKLKN